MSIEERLVFSKLNKNIFSKIFQKNFLFFRWRSFTYVFIIYLKTLRCLSIYKLPPSTQTLPFPFGDSLSSLRSPIFELSSLEREDTVSFASRLDCLFFLLKFFHFQHLTRLDKITILNMELDE